MDHLISGAKKRVKGNKQNSIMAAVKRKMQPVTRVSNGPSKSLRWDFKCLNSEIHMANTF